MNWKQWLNAVGSAAISGAVTAAIPLVKPALSGAPIDWSVVSSAAAAGAAVGIVNHFRKSPRAPMPVPQERPKQ